MNWKKIVESYNARWEETVKLYSDSLGKDHFEKVFKALNNVAQKPQRSKGLYAYFIEAPIILEKWLPNERLKGGI